MLLTSTSHCQVYSVQNVHCGHLSGTTRCEIDADMNQVEELEIEVVASSTAALLEAIVLRMTVEDIMPRGMTSEVS